LFLPALSDMLSLLSYRSAPAPNAKPGERLLILVPAHNEESLLADCLDALARAASGYDAVDVVVVADNCSDRTAEIARERGFRCLERHDASAPGKPPALAWAIEQEASRPYHAVAVVDADTIVAPDFCTAVLAAGPWQGRAGQARQQVRTLTRTWLTGLSELLFEFRYGLALPLKMHAGLNCPLTGTGMVFGREVISPAMWRAFGPTEDIELYGCLTAAGTSITYVGEAVVTVLNEARLKASVTQRRRWSAGRWLASQRYLGVVLRSARVSARQKVDATAELLVPGPVEHLLIAVPALLVASFAGVVGGSGLLALFALGLARPALYTMLAILRHPQPLQALATLTMLPVYAVWRLAVTLSAPAVFLTRKWEKTNRLAIRSSTSE
jgi:cellulose synthase/poly-beta-1,6-N-acetylglucosamine synthase-like glycosyltransferase